MAERVQLPIAVRSRPGSAERKASSTTSQRFVRPATPPGRKVIQDDAWRKPTTIPPTINTSIINGEEDDCLDPSEIASSTKIKVVCRLQPLTEQERKEAVPVVTASTERQEVVAVKIQGDRQSRLSFHFDHVLSSFSTQLDVFAVTLKPLIRDVLAGYEAAVFAYGQTGTGKTYTMEGDLDSSERRGLVPRAAEALTRALAQGPYSDYAVFASCLEIYNEELIDLLATQSAQQKLELKETGHGVCCVGLSETPISSLSHIQELIRKSQAKRQVAETKMNARSSRSHCLFTFKVNCRQRVEGGEVDCTGKLHLVDLAGSECAKHSDYGNQEASVKGERERRNINQSLLTLGRVIGALRESSSRVPYRDSKLTRMLQEALGGGCRTVMIATISSRQSVIDETISTLQYAEKATGIQNKLVQVSSFRSGRTPSHSPDACSFGDFEGRADVHELEMRLDFLTQEVEEAHAAFEQKQREASEMRAQAEEADLKHREMAAELEEMTRKEAARDYAFTRVAQFADDRSAEVERLASILHMEQQKTAGLASQISQQKAQVNKVCTQGQQQASSLSNAAQAACAEVANASDMARCKQVESMSSLTRVASEQGQLIATLLDAVGVHGGSVDQKLQDTLSSLAEKSSEQAAGQESSGKRLSRAMQTSLQALQDILFADVAEIEKHRDAVGDIRSQVIADSAEALARRAATREAVEQLVSASMTTAAEHVYPFRDALQAFDREFSARSCGLEAALTSLASHFTAIRNELSKVRASGESSVRDALSVADKHLTSVCSEADKELVGLRKLLLNASAKLSVDNAAEIVGKRLSDASATLAESVGQELVALAAARKAVVDDLEMLRKKMAAEQEIVHCLTQQREQLSEEVKKMQASLVNITKDANGAHASLTSIEEEQSRQRETTMAAIVRGVQDLVRSEMEGLGRTLASGTAPIHEKLDRISAHATEADASLIAADQRAVDAGIQAAKLVSAWAVETESACNSIQSAQAKVEHAAKEIQTATGAAATSITSLCDQVQTWGTACTSAHEIIDGAADSAKNIASMQESLLHKWETSREVAMRSTQEWANGLNSADNTLESLSTRHSDAAQEIIGVCKHVTEYNATAREAILELVSHEERHAVALDKLSVSQARHAEEESNAEKTRCKHLDMLVDSAGTSASTASCHSRHFRESWQHMLEASETVSTAAHRADEAAQEHRREIDTVGQLASEAEEAHQRFEVAREKYSTHVASLRELPSIYRDGMAEAPLSAFTEEAAQDENTEAPQVFVSLEKRPNQDELIAEYQAGKPDLDSKNSTVENQPGTFSVKEAGTCKIRPADKPSTRTVLKEVQRAPATIR